MQMVGREEPERYPSFWQRMRMVKVNKKSVFMAYPRKYGLTDHFPAWRQPFWIFIVTPSLIQRHKGRQTLHPQEPWCRLVDVRGYSCDIGYVLLKAVWIVMLLIGERGGGQASLLSVESPGGAVA